MGERLSDEQVRARRSGVGCQTHYPDVEDTCDMCQLDRVIDECLARGADLAAEAQARRAEKAEAERDSMAADVADALGGRWTRTEVLRSRAEAERFEPLFRVRESLERERDALNAQVVALLGEVEQLRAEVTRAQTGRDDFRRALEQRIGEADALHFEVEALKANASVAQEVLENVASVTGLDLRAIAEDPSVLLTRALTAETALMAAVEKLEGLVRRGQELGNFLTRPGACPDEAYENALKSFGRDCDAALAPGGKEGT